MNLQLTSVHRLLRSSLIVSQDLMHIVAVAKDLDASSELCVICIDLLQKNINLLTIALGLVVLPKGVKCVFKTSCVSLKGESGIILVKDLINIVT